MTRLAREIPTDPAHPIKKNRTFKDKTYTAYKKAMNDEKSKRIFTIKEHSIRSDSRIILKNPKPLQDQRKTKNGQYTYK